MCSLIRIILTRLEFHESENKEHGPSDTEEILWRRIGSTKLLTWEGTKVGDKFKRVDGFKTQAGEKLEGLTRRMENRPSTEEMEV